MFSIRSFLIIFIFCLLCVSANAQANWLWAGKGSSGGQDAANAVVVDPAGNSYYTGYFTAQLQFTGFSMNSVGGTDVFVVKVDPLGGVMWAARAGGGYNDIARDICIDQNGDVWITGEYLNGAYFGSTYLSGSGGMDLFVAKISPNGSWLTAYRATCNNYAYSYGIAVNTANDIVIVGAFMSQITFGSSSYTASGGTDIFIAIFAQSGGWSASWKYGSSGMDYAYDVVTAANYEQYICGAFSGNINYGSGTLYLSGSRDAFVMRHSPGSGVIWARGAGATGTTEATALCKDSNTNIFFTGHFNSTAGFGSTFLSTVGNDDVFLSGLNSSGNWLGALRAGGTGYDFATDIAFGADSFYHLCGYYTGTPAFGATSLPNSSNYQIFYARSFATSGWADARAAGGSNSDYAYALTTDALGYVYMGGSFYGSATFGSISLTGTSSDDVWFGKFDSIIPPANPTTLYPGYQATNLPPNLTLVWDFDTGNYPPPSQFLIYINGSLLSTTQYIGDQIYAKHISLNYGQTCTWQIVAQSRAGVNCQSPPLRSLGIMAQPASGQASLVPSQVVYDEYTQSGTSSYYIGMPSINLLSSTVYPSFVFIPGSSLTNYTTTVELMDKSFNTMPNPAACLCAFTIKLPQNIQMQISLNHQVATTSSELLHWNGSSWDDLSSTATFGAGTVSFTYTSTSRGTEEFAINDGNGSTLSVQLSSFAAIASANNLAQLNWITASETALLGFNLYRNQSEQLVNALRVNGTIIEATNSSTTQHYSYIDSDALPNTSYYYWLECLEIDGEQSYYGPVSICLAPNLEPPTPPINRYGIQSIYPNPFNPSTRLDFCLKTGGSTRVLIYNSRAQIVRELDLGYIPADTQERLVIDGLDSRGNPLASGIYIIKLISGDYIASRRIILAK